MKEIFNEIQKERDIQDQQWGIQDHNEHKWLSILMEEVGEACKAALEDEEYKYRRELIQVAAVAVAITEWLDNQ